MPPSGWRLALHQAELQSQIRLHFYAADILGMGQEGHTEGGREMFEASFAGCSRLYPVPIQEPVAGASQTCLIQLDLFVPSFPWCSVPCRREACSGRGLWAG